MAGTSRAFFGIAARLFGVSIAVFIHGVASQGLDVCPANSQHKSLPFLKAAKPEAIATILATDDEFSINMQAVIELVKTTLVPMIGANAFFFALTAVFLLIFILWRFLRFCCFMICCKRSCDAKREKNNIYKLLFNKRMRVLKAFMCLFGLVAIAFAVYGMASVSKQKDIVGPAFGVVQTLSNYFDEVSSDVDNLVATISNVTGIIDDFKAIITVDINVDNLTATLTAIGTFLDSTPNPPSVLTAINALKNRYDTFKGNTGSLQNYVAGVTTFNTERTTLNNNLQKLITRKSSLDDMKTKITNVQSRLTTLGTAFDTNSPASRPSAAALSDLNDGLAVVDTVGWPPILDEVSAAIDAVASQQATTANPFGKLWRLADVVQQDVSGMSADIDGLITAIRTLQIKNADMLPTLNYLTEKLKSINATVLELTAGMQGAYNSLATANSSVDAVFSGSPSPASQAITDMTTFKTSLPSTSFMDSVKIALSDPRDRLASAPFAPGASTYKNWLSTVKGLLSNTAIGDFKSALSAYMASPADATWYPLSAELGITDNEAKITPFKNILTQLTGSNGFDSSVMTASTGSSAASFSTAATSLQAAGTDSSVDASVAASSSVASAARSAAPTTMTVPGVATQLAAVKAIYDGFGTPYSAVVNGPKTELISIKNSAISAGDDAKAQIMDGIAGVNSTIGSMQAMLVDQLSSVQTQYEPTAVQYDSYRYSGSMALYGVSILFVSLVLLSAYLNYHFGANFSILGLLNITTLYLLLALLITVILSFLYLACGHLEALILQIAPSVSSTLAPLLRYYFLEEGTSLKAVLKASNMADIDAMFDQIKSSQADVLAGLAESFTFKSAPLAVLGRINGTISGVEAGVNTLLTTLGREGLLPVYGEVKGLVCCAIPDILATMWIGLTFAGIFAFVLIFCTFFFIGKIDRTPRKDCCGCTCHTQGKYAGTVFPDTIPQFHTPGFDNPLGPYDAPTAATSQWSGSGEAVVTINTAKTAKGAKKEKGR